MKTELKFLVLLFSVVWFTGCQETSKKEVVFNENTTVVIDSFQVAKIQLVLNQLEGTWYYKNKPFNGYALKFYSNGVLEERLGFYNGKREGVAKRWSENGVLRVESFYRQNKLVGTYKGFWENGKPSEASFYVDGVKQGEEKQWYDNGQLAKLRRLVDGTEQGMQQAWLKNGTMYINYEAKNGRVFGLLRSNLCYQLEDEVVIRE
ncbi:toxin-antitoxin system YwqK family antitoxin [Mariniflexile sp.]|uniref:toxin-antitoxin system YwqK family antitoxin n=1 Tax=Mariniflexile sp. TaxID=1979402 RepID=UPI00356137AD